MQIVFHMGAHGTDGDRMMKALMMNRDTLARQGCEVLAPSRFMGVIDNSMRALSGGPSTPEMEQIMLNSMLDSDGTRRVVCSSPNLQGPGWRAIDKNGLYPQMGRRVAALRALFPSSEVEFFIGLRNPTLLLPVLLAQSPNDDYASLTKGLAPADLGWFAPVRDAVSALQGRGRMVIWCHEDTPLIWPELLRMVGAIPADQPLDEGQSFLAEALTGKGLRAMQAEAAKRDQMSIAARRALAMSYLQTHANSGTVTEEVTLPGWTQEVVDAVTAQYQADVGRIAVLPGVEFIMP